VQPAQVAIRALELVELGMLADPEHPSVRTLISQVTMRGRADRARRSTPARCGFPPSAEMHAQHENRHRHPEYAVTEIGDATDVARRDLVEMCFHVAVS